MEALDDEERVQEPAVANIDLGRLHKSLANVGGERRKAAATSGADPFSNAQHNIARALPARLEMGNTCRILSALRKQHSNDFASSELSSDVVRGP